MTIMAQEGFVAEISIDEDRGLLCGVLVNLSGSRLHFEAETVPALRAEMQNAVAGLKEDARRDGRPAPEPTHFVSAQHFDHAIFNELIGTRPEHDGALPYLPLALAYDLLLGALKISAQEFVEKEDFGRDGAIAACDSLIRFISRRWEHPELATPFIHIKTALQDIRNNITNELFSHRTESLVRSRSTSFRRIKDFAAALLQVLFEIRSGQSGGRERVLQTAAKEVARSVSVWPAIHPGARITARTVVEWRSEVTSRPSGDRRDYDRLVLYLLEMSPSERDRDVRRLLKDGPPGLPKAVVSK